MKYEYKFLMNSIIQFRVSDKPWRTGLKVHFMTIEFTYFFENLV